MALFTPQQRQTALWTGIGILLVAILLLLGPILTPFIAGSILAYALNPIVDWLRAQRLGNFRIPRIIAVIIVGISKLYYMHNGMPYRLVTDSPYFFLALTSMIIGTQLFVAGFLGELISRNAPERNKYQIEKTI